MPTDQGICVIDVEDTFYLNLRKNPDAPEFKEAESRFINVISIMKHFRLNIKIGIYSLPFTMYYSTDVKYNGANKFDPLLKYCDFICPSLYITFPDIQIGHQKNIEFLRKNLSLDLSYSYRLKKPLMPFVWEIVHPSNKIYGGSLLPKREFLSFIDFIVNYDYSNTGIDGLFLWNPSIPSPAYMGTLTSHELTESVKKAGIKRRDSTIRDYYTGIIKIINSSK